VFQLRVVAAQALRLMPVWLGPLHLGVPNSSIHSRALPSRFALPWRPCVHLAAFPMPRLSA